MDIWLHTIMKLTPLVSGQSENANVSQFTIKALHVLGKKKSLNFLDQYADHLRFFITCRPANW